MLRVRRKCLEEHQRNLNIYNNALQNSTSPEKQNIKLLVVKIFNTMKIAMSWIMNTLSDNTLPRAILNCNSIKTA